MASVSDIEIHPFFIERGASRLFCLSTSPRAGKAEGAVLYLHPFAEEMHKSRRMAALQARALARRGYRVLQVDLTGCGDSSGDFSDASWDVWRGDALAAYEWLAGSSGLPVNLWGLRSGAALAADLASSLPGLGKLILWQPMINGDQFLGQFLRIRLAAEMLSGVEAQAGGKALRGRLAAGECVEVGGNMLSPRMAEALGCFKLSEIIPSCPVLWLEVGAEASDRPTPAGQRVVDAWRSAGIEVTTGTVLGDPFWGTQEITECPDLLAATNAWMAPLRGSPSA